MARDFHERGDGIVAFSAARPGPEFGDWIAAHDGCAEISLRAALAALLTGPLPSLNLGDHTVALTAPLAPSGVAATGRRRIVGGRLTAAPSFTGEALCDLSALAGFSDLVLDGQELHCANRASGLLLPEGGTVSMTGCTVDRPALYGIADAGRGCHEVAIAQCHVTGRAAANRAADLPAVGLRLSGHGAWISGLRTTHLRHAAVLTGRDVRLLDSHVVQGGGVAVVLGGTGAWIDGCAFDGAVSAQTGCGLSVRYCRLPRVAVGDDASPDLTGTPAQWRRSPGARL